MNEEIKIGEYVRTKDGYIAKLINYGTNKGINGKSVLFDGIIRDISNLIYDEDNFLFDCELDEYIVKHSPNIIDLIEVGDIVVTKHPALEHTYYEHIWNEEYLKHIKEFLKEKSLILKSIVTKEQFKEMEYKVDQ